ncbi:MAG TPA: creatininase family protein [Stellaceae bacterium]|nr:creatininase family protein [Stellaceae bacterium]
MDRRRFLALAAAGLSLPATRPAAAATRSPFIDDLTWIEVRDAVHAGANIAIVPTGGSEENGPHMAIGKHNFIVHHCAGEIARRVGNALVAPVVAYVPEGNFEPPTDNMALPGTIGVSEPTFAAVLREAAQSLALAGFRLICFIGDHGLSQASQAHVAAALTRQWRKSGVRVATIDRYYAADGEREWLKTNGYSDAEIGLHAGLLDTAELMAIEPGAVRGALLSPKGWPEGRTGASGDPSRATAAIGEKLLEFKIAAAVAEIRELVASMPASPRD